MSLLFAALLAASFAVTPSNAPESSSSSEKTSAVAARAGSDAAGKKSDQTSKQPLLPNEQAEKFIAVFLKKGGAYEPSNDPIHVLFATVADPVQTHLAAVFDHDVAALQDGVQDSGYLFDSSWVPWDSSQPYDSFEDEINAEELRRLKHDVPGILLFRRDVAEPNENPYADGLIVFLLAEKPTAGINIAQAINALRVLASATAEAGPAA